MLDLILRGGRLLDPANGVDRPSDIGFADGRVAGIDLPRDAAAVQVCDVSGLLVTPGLIDLHTHVYWGATSISVRPDEAAGLGVTTLVDAGSAGAGTFAGFREQILERANQRILAFLNVSFPGIYAYSRSVMVGESSDLRLLNLRDCVRVLEQNRDLLVGIKVRVGLHSSAAAGIAPLAMAIEAAERADVPVMVHIDEPPPSRRDILALLRPGDILTHCFRGFPNSPLRADRQVQPDVVEARARGVLFDIGHGNLSFGFEVARGMLANGFMPDIISSDLHVLNVGGPVYDLPTTLSKFLALGAGLNEVINAATVGPARALRRPDLGHLTPGAVGDASILDCAVGEFAFRDATGLQLTGGQGLHARGCVMQGKLKHLSSGRGTIPA